MANQSSMSELDGTDLPPRRSRGLDTRQKGEMQSHASPLSYWATSRPARQSSIVLSVGNIGNDRMRVPVSFA